MKQRKSVVIECNRAIQYKQVLEKNPYDFKSLVKWITLLQRNGQLEEASRIIKKLAISDSVCLQAGFKYCQGLLAR